jgi:primase-polymerase (primpol)-like protein
MPNPPECPICHSMEWYRDTTITYFGTLTIKDGKATVNDISDTEQQHDGDHWFCANGHQPDMELHDKLASLIDGPSATIQPTPPTQETPHV